MSKLEMDEIMVKIRERPKKWRRGSRTGSYKPLVENNNSVPDGYNQASTRSESPLSQNTFNTQEEQHLHRDKSITLKELDELLDVTDEAITPEDGSCCSVKSDQQKITRSIRGSVSKKFPNPPAELNKYLQIHLQNVQETIYKDLKKLGPTLEPMGHFKCLVDCYHRHTFDHLNDLLQIVSSVKNSFVLIKWVLHSYLSQDLLCHPELQEMDLLKKVDLLLFTDWAAKAKDKLLENVQTEIRQSLEKILQNERNQRGFDREEDCVQLYVDTSQCIDAMPKVAQTISSKLSDHVREVCFQELLEFLGRYTDEQSEILKREAKMDKPETKHFLKTLNTCKQLKQHVQTSGKGITTSLFQDTVGMLEDMELFTRKLLMGIVTDTAEFHLKKNFKTENKEFSLLILAVKEYFPVKFCQNIQETVIDEAYKLIVHIYLKHLIRRSRSKLEQRWSPDVGQTVADDAELLHSTIRDMAPGVQQWNLMLLIIPELLEDKEINSVKMTVGKMQEECPTWSSDMDLVPALLRWKGQTGRDVMEVLDALPEDKPKPRYKPWYSALSCCTGEG